jgi:hypothetical protein
LKKNSVSLYAIIGICLIVAITTSFSGRFSNNSEISEDSYLSNVDDLTGQAYVRFTPSKKQHFRKCLMSECFSIFKKAIKTKNYSMYRACSLNCLNKVESSSEQNWCLDSDGNNHFAKGRVTSNKYSSGKEDYCHNLSNGKSYLIEGLCINKEYVAQKKYCVELGRGYVCEAGVCLRKNKQVKIAEKTPNLIGIEGTTQSSGSKAQENPVNSVLVIEESFADEIIIKSESITSKSGATDWEYKSAMYDIYFYEQKPDLRVVCQQPCSIPEQILKNKLKGLQNAINILLNLTKIDVLPSLQPVDVHLTSSLECGDYQNKFDEFGYVSRFAGSRPESLGGSYMCLWEWDDDNLILKLNEDNALRLEAQGVPVHEYSHILFYRRSFASPESFVKALQFYISGIWDGNGYKSENFQKVTGACDEKIKNSAGSIYNLCTKCGLRMEDFSTLLEEINILYQNSEGEKNVGGSKPKVSIPQMKTIIDKITGHDSVLDCGVTWLGN